ncbi:hypothetical protein ABQF34_01200 [Mycolicibacterium boenickei]
MKTNAATSTVVELATHPLWCSSQRYSRELATAMRRHPSSYRPDEEDDALDPEPQALSQRTNGRVVSLTCARVVKLKAARSAALRD